LPVVAELIQYPNIRVNLIGGEVDNERKAVFGYLAESMLENYHANKAFIGCDGISLQKGLTTNDEKEAAISRKTAAIAENVFLLCDSSKVEKNSYVRFAPLSLIDALVTDKELDDAVVRDYKNNDIKIIN
jgi:DeoR family transcriptional regulator, fructose operon transcriptional repressor